MHTGLENISPYGLMFCSTNGWYSTRPVPSVRGPWAHQSRSVIYALIGFVLGAEIVPSSNSKFPIRSRRTPKTAHATSSLCAKGFDLIFVLYDTGSILSGGRSARAHSIHDCFFIAKPP